MKRTNAYYVHKVGYELDDPDEVTAVSAASFVAGLGTLETMEAIAGRVCNTTTRTRCLLAAAGECTLRATVGPRIDLEARGVISGSLLCERTDDDPCPNPAVVEAGVNDIRVAVATTVAAHAAISALLPRAE